MLSYRVVLDNSPGPFDIDNHSHQTGDTVTLVTTYPTQHKAHKRYTACPECKHELHSPQHDMHHNIWELQQMAKLSNIQIVSNDTSIVVESEWQGKRYRGVLYPVKDDKVIQ